MHAVRFPVLGSYTAVMPRLRASRPVRRGVECALRSRAAVDVLFNAGLPGLCAKRSGRGVFVDLIVRTEVYAIAGRDDRVAFCGMRGMRERVDDGRRKAGGRRPQLRGVLGGIVDVVALQMGCDGFEVCSVDFWGSRSSGRFRHVKACSSQSQGGRALNSLHERSKSHYQSS